MKNFLLTIILVLSFFYSPFLVQADIIVLKDGTSLTAYNIEKGKGNVFYTLTSDEDAPLKKLSLSEVFAIKIGDGQIQIVESEPNQCEGNNDLSVENVSDVIVAPNNQSLINQYNDVSYTFKEKEKDKEAKSVIAVWGVSPTSVLSSDEVEIRFETGLWYQNKWIPLRELAKKRSGCNSVEVRIFIHNKTKSNLYVDLSRTIRNSSCIGYRQFYDGSIVSHGNSSSSAVGVGVGLIGLGTSSGTSRTLTETQPSTLIIFPDSEVELPRESYIGEYDKKIYDRYEKLSNIKGVASFASKIGAIKQYQSVAYDYKDSPEKISYSILISKSSDFASCKSINFSFYIRQLIGLPSWWNIWTGRQEDELRKITPLTNTSILSTFNLAD